VKSVLPAKAEGYLLLVLHAHLPYIRHPEHEHHLEETWLYEAIMESYLPLIGVFEDLLNDGMDFGITLSLTPPLLEMLSDPLLMARFQRYLDSRIDLAEKEVFRTRNDPRLAPLARMYHHHFLSTRHLFVDTYRKNLISAFRALSETGKVELITCAATHAYLPLHMAEPSTIQTQVSIGTGSFQRHFGKRPVGMWLPECGYAPGLDTFVKESGIDYIFLESHGLLNAAPKPTKSIYRPVRTPAGLLVFGRDTESSRQVWSSQGGYPGDADYRDFYRDIGFDLDYAYVKPYLPGGIRTFTGIKYFRVTGKADSKDLYDRERGLRKAALHAEHFMQAREEQILFLRKKLGTRPVITAAYDAELFGHWWHEGPEWLRFVLRNPSIEKRPFRLITPSEYTAENHEHETVSPSASSWGRGGYSGVWLDPANSWIYKHLKKAAGTMAALSKQHGTATGLLERALNQALRELLIAQASDWPFMMRTGNAVQFAEETFKEHLNNFFTLVKDIRSGDIREVHLTALEKKNAIFRDIDFRVFAPGLRDDLPSLSTREAL